MIGHDEFVVRKANLQTGKNICPCIQIMFAVGGESQIELFEYSTIQN